MAAMTRAGQLRERAELAAHGWTRLVDIPTEKFTVILGEYLSNGWAKSYVYDGVDAWIDYGRVDLQKGAEELRFEWTNWTEGEIWGPPAIINEIARVHALPIASS